MLMKLFTRFLALGIFYLDFPFYLKTTFYFKRAKSTRGDWIIEECSTMKNVIHVAGIDSPGFNMIFLN